MACWSNIGFDGIGKSKRVTEFRRLPELAVYA